MSAYYAKKIVSFEEGELDFTRQQKKLNVEESRQSCTHGKEEENRAQ